MYADRERAGTHPVHVVSRAQPVAVSVPEWRNAKAIKHQTSYLFDNPEVIPTDAVFHVGPHSEVIRAHRWILGMRSAAFYNMFYQLPQELQNASCEKDKEELEQDAEEEPKQSEEGTEESADKEDQVEADQEVKVELEVPEKKEVTQPKIAISQKIDLPDVDPDAFKIMLGYIYKEDTILEMSKAMDTLYCAKKFTVPELESSVQRVIANGIAAGNAFQVLEKARKMNDNTLVERALGVIFADTKTSLEAEWFLDVSREVLADFLKSDSLDAPELDIYRAAYKWAVKNCAIEAPSGEELRTFLGDCFNHIRLPLLEAEDFVNGPFTDGLVTSIEKESFFLSKFGKDKPDMPGFSKQPRKYRKEISQPERSTPSRAHHFGEPVGRPDVRVDVSAPSFSARNQRPEHFGQSRNDHSNQRMDSAPRNNFRDREDNAQSRLNFSRDREEPPRRNYGEHDLRGGHRDREEQQLVTKFRERENLSLGVDTAGVDYFSSGQGDRRRFTDTTESASNGVVGGGLRSKFAPEASSVSNTGSGSANASNEGSRGARPRFLKE